MAYAPNCIVPPLSVFILSLFFVGASGRPARDHQFRGNSAHDGAYSGRGYLATSMRACSGAYTRLLLAPAGTTDGYALPPYPCGIRSLRGWETDYAAYPRARPCRKHPTTIAALRMRGGGADASPRKMPGKLGAAGARDDGAGRASKKPRNKKLPQRSREKVCLCTCV
jgi:hypothetical protein